MNPRVVENTQELAREAVAWIEHHAMTAIMSRGGCHILLAGGRTPLPVYRSLAATQAFFHERVDYYFGDERCVPPDHADSNYRAVVEAMFPKGVPPDIRFHRMHGEDPDRDRAARSYEDSMPEVFDILLLGVGADGHTASLFPGSAALREMDRRVVPADGPKPLTQRLTITPRVIRETRNVLVMAAGASKAPVLGRALNNAHDPEELPIQLAAHGAWLVDRSAAGSFSA